MPPNPPGSSHRFKPSKFVRQVKAQHRVLGSHELEALLLWMFENFWDPWMLRAKFSISNPDLTMHKDEDGNFLKGLENMQGRYTSSCAGRQPFGGITAVGIDRLTKLTKEIEKNRVENAEFIKLVEDEVRAMVCERNSQQEFNDNKKKGGKKKSPTMMSETESEGPVDMGNDYKW